MVNLLLHKEIVANSNIHERTSYICISFIENSLKTSKLNADIFLSLKIRL